MPLTLQVFSGDKYWRFDDAVGRVELDYPRDISMWRGVPSDVDAAFQYIDGKTYFFKVGLLEFGFGVLNPNMFAFKSIFNLQGPLKFRSVKTNLGVLSYFYGLLIIYEL